MRTHFRRMFRDVGPLATAILIGGAVLGCTRPNEPNDPAAVSDRLERPAQQVKGKEGAVAEAVGLKKAVAQPKAKVRVAMPNSRTAELPVPRDTEAVVASGAADESASSPKKARATNHDGVTLYSTTTSGSGAKTPNTLITVDPSSGRQRLSGPKGQTAQQRFLDGDPVSGLLYGVSDDNYASTLNVIDPAAGSTQRSLLVRQGDAAVQVQGLAVSPEGTLIGSVRLNTLGTIDRNSGVFSPVSQLNIPDGDKGERGWVKSIDFALTGEVYAVLRCGTRQLLTTVNWQSGALTGELKELGSLSVGDIDCASDGYIYADNFSSALVRIDPATGETIAVGHGNIGGLSGLASAPKRVSRSASDISTAPHAAWDGSPRLTLRGHGKAVKSVAFSPDGKTIATGSWDGTVKLWDATSGRERTTFDAFKLGVNSIAFSPDGTILAAGGWKDATVLRWEVTTGRKDAELPPGEGSYGINAVAFSPDGETLAAACSDRTAKLWNLRTGELRATFTGHTHFVLSVAFSPDGKIAATGSFVGETVKLWDTQTAKELVTLKSEGGPIASVAFSPDGRTLATGSWDKIAELWDVEGHRVKAVCRGHTGKIETLAFSRDGKWLATGTMNSPAEVKLWDPRSGNELADLPVQRQSVAAVAFSPDGKTLATGGLDGTVDLWNVAQVLSRPRRIPAAVWPVDPEAARVEKLVQRLGSREANQRQEAVTALYRMGAKAAGAAPALKEALSDEDIGVRVFAAGALANIGTAEADAAVAAVATVLRHRDTEALVRLFGADLLVRLGRNATVVVPTLEELVKDEDPEVRVLAFRVMLKLDPSRVKDMVPACGLIVQDDRARIPYRIEAVRLLSAAGPGAKAAVPVLVHALIDETQATLNRIRDGSLYGRGYSPSDYQSSIAWEGALINAISRISPQPDPAVPTLIPALVMFGRQNPGSEVVKRALSAIYPFAVKFGGPTLDPASAQAIVTAALPGLVETLEHEDPLLREAAAEAIGCAGAAAGPAIVQLNKLLEREEKTGVRVAAALAILKVDPNTKSAMKALIAALEDQDRSGRLLAVEALYELGPAASEATTALVAVALHENGRACELAKYALRRIGPETVPPLIDGTDSREAFVRCAAIRALAAVAPRFLPSGANIRVAGEPPPQRPIPAEQVIQPLVKALRDPDRNVRFRAANALGALAADASSAAQPLIELLKDPDQSVRWEAAAALKQIKVPAAESQIAAAVADQPSKTNAKGDTLTLVGFDPPLPAVLKPGDDLVVRYAYTLASSSACFTWAHACTDGKPSAGAGHDGCKHHPKGSGLGQSVVYPGPSRRIEQVRMIMSPDTVTEHALVELLIDVDASWQQPEE